METDAFTVAVDGQRAQIAADRIGAALLVMQLGRARVDDRIKRRARW